MKTKLLLKYQTTGYCVLEHRYYVGVFY